MCDIDLARFLLMMIVGVPVAVSMWWARRCIYLPVSG